MSLTLLAQGRLICAPQLRTGKGGKQFATFTISVHVEDDDPVSVSGVAFETAVVEKLARLKKGETVAVTGRAKVASWQGKDGTQRTGLSVVADALLTVYGLSKRRGATSKAQTAHEQRCELQLDFVDDQELEF